MSFDKNKSHLSALQKAEFEKSTTASSSVQSVPGIGKKATEHLAKQNIKTIDDLLESIQNDFSKLVSITPTTGINNHKIYDALETYLQPHSETDVKPKPATQTSKDSTLPEILKAKENGCCLQ